MNDVEIERRSTDRRRMIEGWERRRGGSVRREGGRTGGWIPAVRSWAPISRRRRRPDQSRGRRVGRPWSGGRKARDPRPNGEKDNEFTRPRPLGIRWCALTFPMPSGSSGHVDEARMTADISRVFARSRRNPTAGQPANRGHRHSVDQRARV